MVFIGAPEKALSNAIGREVEFEKVFETMKPGDDSVTYASTNRLHEAVGFKPETKMGCRSLRIGMWGIRGGVGAGTVSSLKI